MVQVKTQRNQKIAGIMLVAAGIAILAFSGLQMTVNERTNVYSSSVTVYSLGNNSSDVNLGVNAGKNLDFGEIPQGTNVTKKISVKTAVPSRVQIKASGNISEYLEMPETVTVEGEKVVPVKISPESPGTYTGIITMRIKVPRGEIGKKWMEIRSQL